MFEQQDAQCRMAARVRRRCCWCGGRLRAAGIAKLGRPRRRGDRDGKVWGAFPADDANAAYASSEQQQRGRPHGLRCSPAKVWGENAGTLPVGFAPTSTYVSAIYLSSPRGSRSALPFSELLSLSRPLLSAPQFAALFERRDGRPWLLFVYCPRKRAAI